MILFTPLKTKKIVPYDWDEWWHIWNTYSAFVSKKYENHNNAIGTWKGLDLYTKIKYKMIYDAPHAPNSKLIDDLIEQIQNTIPIHVFKVRVIENFKEVPYHADHSYPKDELRCFLWNNYDTPVWSFSYKNTERQLVMPSDSNTYYYKDFPLKHHSVYDPTKSKGVMAIYGMPKSNFTEFINDSVTHYKNYAWVI